MEWGQIDLGNRGCLSDIRINRLRRGKSPCQLFRVEQFLQSSLVGCRNVVCKGPHLVWKVQDVPLVVELGQSAIALRLCAMWAIEGVLRFRQSSLAHAMLEKMGKAPIRRAIEIGIRTAIV